MAANAQIARLFYRMADVMAVTGDNPFKIAAYQRAARVIEELGEDLSANDDVKKLCEIPGIGKALAEKIIEYCRTGTVKEIEQAADAVPSGVLELINVPGLGPKTAAVLWKKGGVQSLEDLKKKLATGELENLPRMGTKSLEKIARSVTFAESGELRVRLGDATPVAEAFVEHLKKIEQIKQIDFAGSLRRGVETIGDIDLVASCINPDRDGPAIAHAFKSLPIVEEVIADGPTKVSVRIARGMQVDLRIIADPCYGAALLYFTGSKAHNVRLRERAIRMGLRLNEYGVWRSEKDKKPLAAATEQDVYKALGLVWLPPEMREDRGEIDVAEKGQVPGLIELSDIKAELHAHTIASDGSWTIEELATAAKASGLHSVAVTDHSVSSAIANGLSPQRLEKHIESIRNAAAKIKGITILAGSEVDILADGRLDYPDSLLAELDIVVASPHAGLTHDPDRATRRLLRAIESPYVHIIGHPTGRLVMRREGINPDMAQVIKAAAQTGTALEINANSHRLDLRDTHARAAIEAGAMLSINTDSHGPADLDQLRYGIATARRAWVEPKHVVNCMTAGQLKKWLTAKRSRML